jgi:hypothetical protein
MCTKPALRAPPLRLPALRVAAADVDDALPTRLLHDALQARGSEGPEHSALPRFQAKVGNAVVREWADRYRHTPGDRLASNGEGFVGIIDRSRNDTPTQILTDFRIGPPS